MKWFNGFKNLFRRKKQTKPKPTPIADGMKKEVNGVRKKFTGNK